MRRKRVVKAEKIEDVFEEGDLVIISEVDPGAYPQPFWVVTDVEEPDYEEEKESGEYNVWVIDCWGRDTDYFWAYRLESITPDEAEARLRKYEPYIDDPELESVEVAERYILNARRIRSGRIKRY